MIELLKELIAHLFRLIIEKTSGSSLLIYIAVSIFCLAPRISMWYGISDVSVYSCRRRNAAHTVSHLAS